ncbi:hypothetical protein CTEN210_02537 [Chaetoceros tenuissimus]|uniref:Uncharacterized protein n=1 Tax=Chaetoceros tenuissimus TaxID=426638 RepID=A0AAD3CI56_9STRA|nr:hypothetical protein CTEN210_02537 [Chaetoceros tenuissimus]
MLSRYTHLLLALVACLVQNSTASSASNLYPVKNLEASITASSSQASVLALRCKDCTVVVSMSPPSKDQTCNLTLSNTIQFLDDDDDLATSTTDTLFPITRRGPVSNLINNENSHSLPTSQSRIMYILQEYHGLALFMTGFASDVQYLTRLAAGYVSQQEYLYSSAQKISANEVMRDAIAPRVRDMTMNGSRPFGIQALAISPSVKSNGAQIVTIDPSGNLRYWHGLGAFIGKDKALIQKHLHKVLEREKMTKDHLPESWNIGLKICLEALLETAEETQNIKETPFEEIESELNAMVIHCQNEATGICQSVSNRHLSQVLRKCHDELLVKHDDKVKT